MKVTMLGVGILLMILVALGTSVVYGVLDPMAQRCESAVRAEGLRPVDVCPRYVDLGVTLILILSAIITFFGTMAIDGAQNPDGSFRESRIRLSIASTILVVYLIYFGMAIMWGDNAGSQGLLTTFTNLMMVVIPFYFASSAAVEWSEKKGTSRNPQEEPPAG